MQSWETASGTRCDSLVTSRKVTHATTTPEFGKWLVRAMQSLNGGMSHSGPRAISSTSGQFWGRAVQASRDSFGSGTLLICGELSPETRKFPHGCACAHSRRWSFAVRTSALAKSEKRKTNSACKDYLPGPFVTVGTSSLFPDDRLR
jgi:hypothetical protein